MLVRITFLWVLGLVTIVPLAVYRLLFLAERHEYAFLIAVSLFWVFGFWGIVGPMLAIGRVRRFVTLLESARSADDMRKRLTDPDGQKLAIELIASEHHIPRWLARIVYKKLLERAGRAGSAE